MYLKIFKFYTFFYVLKKFKIYEKMENLTQNFPENEINQIKEVLSYYSNLIQGEHDVYSNKNLKMQIPILPINALTYLVEEVTNIFTQEPTMLELSSPICVVGDIHGQIIDLFRVFKQCGQPPNRRFLFLGDFIDRGHFSLEVLILVYSLKLLFPSNIYIIRGNHEFECDLIVDHCLFCSEIETFYGKCSIYDQFIKSFTFLPLAAKVDNFFLCLHGGISEDFISIDQIRSIERPIVNFKGGIIEGILWSDPIDNPQVEFKESPRGYGQLFGLQPVKNFLEENGLRFLVRGHQCKKRGFESSCGGRVLTVFSASNYFGVEGNRSAVLFIQPKGDYKTRTFPPFNEICREDANFLTIDEYRAHRNKRKVTSSHSNDRPFKNKRVNKVVRQNMKLMNPEVGRRRNLSVQNQKYDSSSLLDGARKKVPTVINPSSASKQANQRGNCRYPSSGRNVHYGMGSRNLFS